MYIRARFGQNNTWNKVQMALQSVDQKARQGKKAGRAQEEERRQDRVDLSPMSRIQSRIESLMSQKQSIIEQKNQLIADTLDAGGDIKSIQSMISLYDEQISNIETQISQTMKEMMEDSLEEEKEEKKDEEPLTKEEQQRRQMNELTSASMDYERTGQIYSAYVHKQGEANVMAAEIKMDGSRGGSAPMGKQERLNDLKQEIDELYTEAMEGYADLSVSLKESAEEAARRPELESEEDEQGEAGENGEDGVIS